ncbi:phosphoglycerol transferase MdoB-like AlkP superfamily enzyme [Keratinibaculum paraultunense]|uniref:Phosphoglycerol transferase MdoB-like AlkP superfamily enzyme n=1 Tax=Keratinibaculum paraultunense TaxID=1278232 RepID=A0A4R3KTY0_9FIRM|nr:LTA synthase family protein [Keratinibaculum paraultunense]QQY79918.1 LTA synthase family protein [Keratinibaculum paraultunense]TCS88809.1 phosphoglycerol transferase MdoB-like AlkP superfamily enzyme [Keratinibaculum paraultunense]
MLILLLILKILLFMHVTNVQYNRLIIFLTSTLIVLFLFSWIYLSKNKKKQTLAFSFYNIISALMFADVMYYTYFNALPSVKMLKQLYLLPAVGDSIKSIFTFTNFLFLADIPFLIFYSKWKKKKIRKENKKYNKIFRWGIPGTIALILVILFSFLIKNELFGPVTNQELFTYHIKDIKKTILGDEEIVQGIESFTQKDLEELKDRTYLDEGKYTGVGRGKNLIVIQVEALQNFVINHYYDGQEITPNLNKLIQQQGSLYFDKYYQLIGRGNTADAEFVSNNSLYPSMDEPTYTQYEENTFYGLPWVLRDNGYTAWVFHGYEKEFWNRSRAYPNQGFERFISEEDYDLIKTIGFGLTDEQFFKQSMDYLKELDSIDDNPFYAFMITLTSHNPFKMPDEYKELKIRKEHENTILGDYIQAIHYTDKALGQFFEALKKEGLYEDTVIALYGDHFAINSLNKDYQKLMSEYLGYTYDLDEMMKIPLIIHIPGENINETISKVGSQLDFMPTILNIMGYQNEKGIMFGRDLINYQGESLVAPQTYAVKGSVITDEILLEMSRDGIFENSRAFRLDTREEVDVLEYKDYHKRAIEEINKSDFILKNNLLKKLIGQ